MSINPKCDKCQKELKKYGGILLSPPDSHSKVIKHHLCSDCYDIIAKKLII